MPSKELRIEGRNGVVKAHWRYHEFHGEWLAGVASRRKYETAPLPVELSADDAAELAAFLESPPEEDDDAE